MKKLVISLLVAALSAAVFTPAQAQDWPGFNRYAEKNAEAKAITPTLPRVILIGDSITEGWYRHHQEFFTSHSYLGRGISGQVSTQMLARFSEDVIALAPKVVVINAGTNDVAENQGPYNEERTFGSIIAMVRLAQANGIKPIMTSVLPAARFKWRPSVTDGAPKIAALNARLQAFAKENGLIYVDYYTPLVVGEEKALNSAYSNDGVHPTRDGYLVMEPLVVEAINKALSSKKYGRLKK